MAKKETLVKSAVVVSIPAVNRAIACFDL